jgi:hypothetical protein
MRPKRKDFKNYYVLWYDGIYYVYDGDEELVAAFTDKKQAFEFAEKF